MKRGVHVEIDRSALLHNFAEVRRRVGQAKILAMLKANAYGHGVLTVAQTLSDADAFGVATLDEALFLRQHNVQKPLVVMSGFTTVAELDAFQSHRLQPVIHSQFQLDLLEQSALDFPLSAWLKVDTGMHRLGFSAKEFNDVLFRVNALGQSLKLCGLMTHLADADNPDRTFTEQQLQLFSELSKNFTGPKSITNSAGILHYESAHADWVRPGIMLYGVSPFSDQHGLDLGLLPVMSVYSSLIAVKQLNAGDAVGYGCTWCCPSEMPVGIAHVGYADGYPRHAKSGTPVLVNGVRCQTVGTVSMDMIAIDLRPCPNAQVGDRVTLWGSDLAVEDVAASAATIPYELLTRIKV